MSAGTAAPSPARTSPRGAPAAGPDDFADLLAGLGSSAPVAAALPAERADLPADQVTPDGTAPGQPELEALAFAVPSPVPGALPAPVAPPEPVALPPAPLSARGPAAAVLAEPAGTHALTARARPALPPSAPTGDSPVTTSPTPVPPASAPADPAASASPGELVLSVPADVAADGPPPALDARTTTSPVAPSTGAQTAGAAVVEAVLPTDGDVEVRAATSAVPAADVPPADPAPAAPTPVVAGAEAGVSGTGAAEPRPGVATPPVAAAPPPPAAQVVQLLSPVLTGPDGTYSLSLQLYPEELGGVQVEVLLRGGEIRLAMHATDETAQAVLRAALPDLRADLHAAGLSATSLTVDDGRPEQSPPDRSPDRRPDDRGDSQGRRSLPYRDADPTSRTPTSHADAALDLRM